jgi:hypothetical protein
MAGGLGSGRIRSSIAVRQTTHPALDQAGHSLCRATDGPHYRDLRRQPNRFFDRANEDQRGLG